MPSLPPFLRPSVTEGRAAVRARWALASTCSRGPTATALFASILAVLLIALAVPVEGAPGVETGPRLAWVRQFGTSGIDWAERVTADATGVYVAGWSAPSYDGPYTGYVRKYTHDGVELWARNVTATGNVSVRDVTVDATGAYIAGWTDGDLQGQGSSGTRYAFIRKYSTDGDELWTRQFGAPRSAGDGAWALTARAGAIYVAGATWGTFAGQTSAGSADAFVRKYTADGDEVWTRQFGMSGNDAARAIVADATGIYVAGSVETGGMMLAFVQKYTQDGEKGWWDQFGFNLANIAWGVATDSSGVYVAGSAEVMVSEGGAGFLRKYTFDGKEIWSREDWDLDWLRGVATGPTGVFTSGTWRGQGDFVQEYDADGTIVWTLFVDTPGDLFYWGDVDVHPTGIYLTGIRWGAFPGQSSAGGVDAYLAKIVVPGGSVVPGSVDLGEVEIGRSATANMTIASTGTAPLTVTNVTLAGGIAGFSLPSPPALPLVVPSGSSVNVTVAFSPSSAGLAEDILRITTDDPAANLTEVALRGTGVPSATSRSLGGLLVWAGIVAGSVAAVAVVAYAVRRRRGTRRDAGGDDEAFHERTS